MATTSDLGLGNKQDLKREILPSALRSGTDYDQVLSTIGLGVARVFETYCNRIFERAVGTTDQFRGDRGVWVVRRFPIESVTKIETRDDYAEGWVEQVITTILNVNEESGLVIFGETLGSASTEARLTYTGGYWYDTDEAYGGSQPSGSTLVPGDLKNAWITQCAAEFERRDAIQQLTTLGPKKEQERRFNVELIADVKRTLDAYRRFAG